MSLLDEVLEMPVHRGNRPEAKMGPDLLQAGRVALLSNEFADEIVDLALPPGEGHRRPLRFSFAQVGEIKTKVKTRCADLGAPGWAH